MVDDGRSQVTLRPRSKLERLLEPLAERHGVPPRPTLPLLEHYARLRLAVAGASDEDARSFVARVAPGGRAFSAADLANLGASALAGLVWIDREAECLRDLRAAGEFAGKPPRGLEAACRGDLADARRTLGRLPGVHERQVDRLLLYAGLHAVVAPTAVGMQVALRLGYPGTTYASVARALDAELPTFNAVEVAWRAHHLLDRHGRSLCVAEPTPSSLPPSRELSRRELAPPPPRAQAPQCAACPVHDGCSFQGRGTDPAERIPRVDENE